MNFIQADMRSVSHVTSKKAVPMTLLALCDGELAGSCRICADDFDGKRLVQPTRAQILSTRSWTFASVLETNVLTKRIASSLFYGNIFFSLLV